MKTNIFEYGIGSIFGLWTFDNLNQCNLVAFFSQKIISAKTEYKTYNGKLRLLLKFLKYNNNILKIKSIRILFFKIITIYVVLKIYKTWGIDRFV